MSSTLISFRLPSEIYDALVAEKQPGESDGTAAIRLLSERLGFTPRAKGYAEFVTTEQVLLLIEIEVANRTSNLAALLADTRNQLEELKATCVPKVRQARARTTRISSDKKLTKVSAKNP